MAETTLTRTEASAAVEDLGWRFLLGTIAVSVPVRTMLAAAALASRVVDICGDDADGHLRVDVRRDRVELMLRTHSAGGVTRRDVEMANAITTALGLTALGPPTDVDRPVQALEIAIDAMDIEAVRPFWRAVFAYAEQGAGEDVELVDPAGQGPTVWFQQMDEPRRQRNRIHFDITVAHDEAERRVQAALAAGGVLVTDAYARSFWVLADLEGNEVCVCTWQDRE
ncbi:MAG: 4a-hydroxytetrahydrobiopterin dehydratase [Actinomycetota bacterium]|jgi:4a-hydroxytetrahydrobiopterin dehydratase|nr:4a-hydroxytetrahydrobiopterin dehydratase [Actinomycetota bacterium]